MALKPEEIPTFVMKVYFHFFLQLLAMGLYVYYVGTIDDKTIIYDIEVKKEATNFNNSLIALLGVVYSTFFIYYFRQTGPAPLYKAYSAWLIQTASFSFIVGYWSLKDGKRA